MNNNVLSIDFKQIEVPDNFGGAEEYCDELPAVKKKAPEPIKSLSDIEKISNWFIAKEKYRDNMLFICGINFGLRCGDLLGLTFGKLITRDQGTGRNCFREHFEVIEAKTGKRRVLYINEAVQRAVALYLEHNARQASDYMFTSECNKEKNAEPVPMHVNSVERILKAAVKACGIEATVATHTLRKTFAYHMIMQAPDRSRAIEMLQKILGHSSQNITLMYAGITDSEIVDMYKGINLGGAGHQNSNLRRQYTLRKGSPLTLVRTTDKTALALA